jgi:Uncharacterized alpha/beta hydrolase domain (DUF2235)
MSKNYRVIPIKLLPGQKYDPATNTLTITVEPPKENGKENQIVFSVTIKEYQERLKALEEEINQKRNSFGFQRLANKSLKPGTKEHEAHTKKSSATDKEIEALMTKRNTLYKDFAQLEWCWQLNDNGVNPQNISHNNAFSKGLDGFHENVNGVKDYLEISISKLVMGGGFVWLEAFKTQDNAADGVNGLFVRIVGKPRIVRSEWTDFDYKPIAQTVGFGSKVLLNIYTENLYGQELDISLWDEDTANPNDIIATRIIAEVNVHPLHDNETGKTGIAGIIAKTKNEPKKSTKAKTPSPPEEKKPEVKETNVQKAVVEVTVNPSWLRHGQHLSIFPKIFLEDTREPLEPKLTKKLDVKQNAPVQTKPQAFNNTPLYIEQVDTQNKTSQNKTPIDFTFGVFIDGTLNNMYDSIARKKWEEDQIMGDKENPENRIKVAANDQNTINKGKGAHTQRYKYEEDSSYENDLSNPAIIYQNYLSFDDDRKFKIYTEGMGTNTLAQKGDDNGDGVLPAARYKENDALGFGLGQGKSGIIERVRRAIELVVEKIEIDKNDEKIGTITVDVFGFSRGAAAARHFVHEITLHGYKAHKNTTVTTGYNATMITNDGTYSDYLGYEVDKKYATKPLPPNGWLGYLLAEKGITMGKLLIRFAGLYDTVPHHGIDQSNDIEALGLNSIAKAQYTVHLVADDEHRKNFSLVDISCITGQVGGGSTNRGIELYLPGVHCDVGGSYVEGRNEKIGRIKVDKLSKVPLEKEKRELVKQGWFENDDLTIRNEYLTRGLLLGDAFVLGSHRKSISNQYSYIPLHIMTDFCRKKGLTIDPELYNKHKFITTKFSNAQFLEDIKKRIQEYAGGGKKFTYEPLLNIPKESTNKEYQKPLIAKDNTLVITPTQEAEFVLHEIEEQEHNKHIRQLRHKYLHWNTAYGEGIKYTILQPYEPNYDKGIRKRGIRG